jgi:hypothetical protein
VVRPALLQRLAALAGIALLGTLGALALVGRDDDDGSAAETPPPQIRWEEARVGVFGADRIGQQTGCGVTLAEDTAGVAHPVLPCGARLVLEREGTAVETAVVERVALPAGRAFDLTPALASWLGLEGGGTVRWRFAG